MKQKIRQHFGCNLSVSSFFPILKKKNIFVKSCLPKCGVKKFRITLHVVVVVAMKVVISYHSIFVYTILNGVDNYKEVSLKYEEGYLIESIVCRHLTLSKIKKL